MQKIWYDELSDLDEHTLRSLSYGTWKHGWAGMSCIGGSVTVSGDKFSTSRKLFVKSGMDVCTLYVKTARMRFSGLLPDGTVSGYGNKREWSELRLPETHRLTESGLGGYLTALDILLATKKRIGVE